MKTVQVLAGIASATCLLASSAQAETVTLNTQSGVGTAPIHWTAEGVTIGDDVAEVGGTASWYAGRSPNHRLTVPVADPSAGLDETIHSVSVRALARSDIDLRGTYDGIKVAMAVGGVSYRDPAIDEVGIGYAYYSHAWTTNPATGAAWTWADITALEASVVTAKSTKPTESILYVDYLEVIVSYGTDNTPPVASEVAASGTATVGEVLTGSYTYSDAENDLEGTSLFHWYRADDAQGTNLAALSELVGLTCEIPLSSEGKYVFFEVTPIAQTGVLEGVPVMSEAIGPIAPAMGSAPVASSVVIDGIDTVGSTLVGLYAYSDADGDAEGTSTYRWVRDGFEIEDATTTAYTLTTADEGSMIVFEVTPVAATGTPTVGLPVASAAAGPIAPATGLPPVASGVTASGVDSVGKTLTGDYSYSDPEGDAEGASILKWLRNGRPIPGATGASYTLTLADEGAMIAFEVTPVSATGSPSRGAPTPSTAIGPIKALVGSAPTASAVAIVGNTDQGDTLTGTYTFADDDGDAEGFSTYRWLRDGVAIEGATASTYAITSDDLGTSIAFEVTPVAATGSPKIGDAVVSDPVAVGHATGSVRSALVRPADVLREVRVVNLRGQTISVARNSSLESAVSAFALRKGAAGAYIVTTTRHTQEAAGTESLVQKRLLR